MQRLFVALVVFGAFFTILPSAPAQDAELPSQSDQLRALKSQREWLQSFSTEPSDLVNQMMNPTSADTAAIRDLKDWSSQGASSLRSAADLLSIYQNVQCDSDRTMLKPLVKDRLQLYAHLLDLDAEGAALPLSIVKEETTRKRALRLRDHLVVAKSKLDEILLSLN